MSFEKELEKLSLERKRSVNQIAKSWGDKNLLLSPESQALERERSEHTGGRLIARLLLSAKELQGRVVGRNKDDANFLCKGLEVIEKEWDLLEHTLRKSEERLHQARDRAGETGQGVALSSPDSSDSNYVTKQQNRIQQLEDQERRLQNDLKQLKTKWEAIMAKTMEQQASVHRQQMQEREALVAMRDAELEKLRRQLPDPASQAGGRRSENSPPHLLKPARRPDMYMMAGRMIIGQTLQIMGPSDVTAGDKLQWYRILNPSSWQPISGATRNQYSPEPYDVGFALGCCITPKSSKSAKDVVRVSSKQPVASYPGFDKAVDALVAEGGAHFSVVVVQRNGMLHTNREVCRLEVATTHVTLRLPNAVTLQQPYNAAMQVCGARGAGDAAAQGLFLAFKPHEVYMLACESSRERNICILLTRKMAGLHRLSLRGPEESAASRS